MTPTPADPLTGGCGCGAVRMAISRPFVDAGYCHCQRCQRRTGTAASLNAMVPADGFAVVAGGEHVRTWRLEDGAPKAFCERCGGALYAGDPTVDELVTVRIGALDADPGIAPRWRQWLSSAPAWQPIVDDGLPRFPRRRPL
jgi:hypothetical protein